MFEMILGLVFVAVSFHILLSASKAETPKGFAIGFSLFTAVLVMAIIMGMGYLWPILVINTVIMLGSLVASLVMYREGKTLLSLYWLLLMIFNGVGVGAYLQMW